MKAFDFSSKIDELMTIKERKKLLREIQDSKRKLFYSNPDVILPFLREKISDSLLHQSKRSTRKLTPSIYKTKESAEDYSALMREHRLLIEKELQVLKATEQNSRKDLERRLETLVTSQEATNNAYVTEIRNMLKIFNEAQLDLRKNSEITNPMIRDLKLLKSNYLLDGGQDPQILHEIDLAIKETDNNTFDKFNDNDWAKRRKGLAVEREKSYELRDLERQNVQLERDLEISRARGGINSERKAVSNETKLYDEKLEQLQRQIEALQSHILNLKMPKNSEQSFNSIESVPLPIVSTTRTFRGEDKRNIVILIDCISGIGQHIRSISVTLSLYIGQEKIGDSFIMESVPVRQNDKTDLDSSVLINIKHPIINCPVSLDTFFLFELGTTTELNNERKMKGWTKLYLFNDQGELKDGSWKESIFRSPVQINLSPNQWYQLEKYHRSILHYRLAYYSSDEALRSSLTSRNYESQSEMYTRPNPFMVNNEALRFEIDSDDNESDVTVDLEERPEFGFQMIRVKNMIIDDGMKLAKIRMTVYHTEGPKKGQIVMSSEGPVTCSTSAVRADFKIACYNLGRQIAKFTNVDLSISCLVYARFYLEGEIKPSEDSNENTMEREEVLAAWTAMKVVKDRTIARRNPSYFTDSLKLMRINRGIHDILLYQPPAIPPTMVFFDRNGLIAGQKLIGRAKLKFRLFHTQLVYDSATSSDDSSLDENEEEIVERPKTWIPVDRTEPCLLSYHHDDGFDLYIDSGRLLPDSVTIIKIEGGIVDRSLNYQGPLFSTITSITSDIYNPVFKERIEIREPHLTPSSTLLLKILTFDREDKNLVVLGYSALKLFVETGSGQQPHFDNLGVLVSLNDGGHQLRIYQNEPGATKTPFFESWFQKNKIQPVPGASILVRLFKPPKNSNGKSININEVPKNYQTRLGVTIEAPPYEDGYYYSMNCKPSLGEDKIMRRHLLRPKIPLQDLVISKWAERLMESLPLREFPENSNIFKLFDMMPRDIFNFNHIAHYIPNNGFKICIDGALNLPWSGYPMMHICMYPPGAIYMKKPLVAYDQPYFVTKLDFQSTHSSPIWMEGWKSYRRRKYNKNLVGILHLHEMKISIVKDDFVFTLENQAWTPVKIFDGLYCITKSTQMPLINGAPTLSNLQELSEKSVQQFLTDNMSTEKIIPLQHSSVIIRQCDSRRQLEISLSAEDELLTLDQSLIPPKDIAAYRTIYESNKDIQFSSTIPAGFTPETFQEFLRVKFKSLIYKLYEQDGFFLQ